MEIDENLYKTFLEEMSALENFRMNYAATHPSVPLESDDPDVRRLIEALALFSARTRIAAISNIVASRRRLFQQLFPYLLSPLPAMAALQARPTGRFVETAVLPKGSEIAVSTQPGGTALFRTTEELRIIPVFLTDSRMLLLPDKGYRLVLQMETPYPRSDEIGVLSFLINHLNDFGASLRIFHALANCLARVSVVFGEKATETSRGVPCGFSLGAPPNTEKEDIDNERPHPLERECLLLHHPQQALYLNVEVPPPPRNWQRFAVCLDLGPEWPRNLVMNKEIFQLFAIPIINLRRGMAQPLICDGTSERYLIRRPMPEYRFALHSILGVYEVTRNGMVPIRAGILSGGRSSYEVEHIRDDQGIDHPYLSLRFPDAFETPKTVAIDALWLQPWFSETLARNYDIAPYSRNIPGLKWELLGDVTPHSENHFSENTDGFMHLLTLGNKHVLNFEDLCGLLQTLWGVTSGRYAKAYKLMTGSRVEEVPPPRNGGRPGLPKHVYYLRFKSFDPGMLPLVETFSSHVGKILDTWMAHTTVETRIDMADAIQPAVEKGAL